MTHIAEHNEQMMRWWADWDLPDLRYGNGFDPDQPMDRKNRGASRPQLFARGEKRVNNRAYAESSDYLYYLMYSSEDGDRYKAYLANVKGGFYHRALRDHVLYSDTPTFEFRRLGQRAHQSEIAAVIHECAVKGWEMALQKTVADGLWLQIAAPPEGEPEYKELKSIADRHELTANSYITAIKNGLSEAEAVARAVEKSGYSPTQVRRITESLRVGRKEGKK